MTLKFDKTQTGDISICIYDGTHTIAFSYVELIKKIMANEVIETDYSSSIKEDERKQIDELLIEIKGIAFPKSGKDTSPTLF